jgi:hypothetical protein
VFSNHPKVVIDSNSEVYLRTKQVLINTLNSAESNSWCARSWNTMMMKAYEVDDEAIFIQDDTDIAEDFGNWLRQTKNIYDFLWGPAGDQFFYMKKSVFQSVGWFDERYIGCYCGDADYLKRVYMNYDRSKLSIEDSHNWGFTHNPTGISNKVITTYQSKTIDSNYDNQHWDFERRCKDNPTLKHSQGHFRQKWGVELDNNQPLINSLSRKMPEINWYPWFTMKHGVNSHDGH